MVFLILLVLRTITFLEAKLDSGLPDAASGINYGLDTLQGTTLSVPELINDSASSS